MTDASRVLDIPEVCLVVLVGASGCGKSTFAAEHFGPFETVSSDFCRGLVSNDENAQSATNAAFDVLHYIVGKRLEAGLLTVVDATNVQKPARQALIKLARDHDVLPVAIVFDLPESVCVERNAQRQDRNFGSHVVRRQRDQLRRSLRGLGKEGFRKVHKLTTVTEVAGAVIERTRLLNDFRYEHGPFDVIGDVHGCRIELEALLIELGYTITRDEQGRAVDAACEGRKAVFVGDLVDRGPDSPGVLRLVMGMVGNGHALAVPGNHENKLVRALRGRNVQATHGLAETLDQLGKEPPEFTETVAEFCDQLVSHLVLDDGKLVVAHAGLKESYHGRASGRVRSFALYGDTTGETDEFGLPVRYPWADEYRGQAMVLYGHTPMPDVEWVNNTMCLDTGCVFGGKLTALRYPEKEVVSVAAQQVWYEPAKPLRTAVPTRESDLLSIDDVLGKRIIETAHHGRITVSGESSAGALEVMSRFAVDPRWLLYLPPTMSPPATATEPGYLEYPTQAFDSFRAEGVTDLICEEKHMGSRAVALIRQDSSAASRFGFASAGVVWTRTGRQFFDSTLTAALVSRIRDAVTSIGLWDELDSDWVLLDCELMPWSAKALDLLRNQYAAVGSAGRAALPAAQAALELALANGKDVGELLARTQRRLSNIEAFGAAYRKYCWPVEGLAGVRIAPFQVLAASGQTFHDRAHVWHLSVADRLAAVDDLFASTRRLVVDAGDAASVQAAVDWWLELTSAGGEGMVVKPAANLTHSRRLVQPGIKVRGREYLRIIYGPDYTEPENLERLRNRGLGHKRSLALREYALGLEALERVARNEPLWRVHEAVFAILACESEPVDPRL